MRERPDNPDAVDLTMRGRAILESNPSKATLHEARVLFERARSLDPDDVPAMIGLARALSWMVNMGWSEDPAAFGASAEESIDAALALQPDNSSAHEERGWVLFAKRQWGPAIVEGEAAIADDFNNSEAQADASYWKMFVGHSEDGVAGLETALRLSPRDPNVPYWRLYICRMHAHLAEWEKAIDSCNKAAAGGAREWGALAYLAAAYAWAGKDKEAKDAVTQQFKVNPRYVVQAAGLDEFDNPTFRTQGARIVEGLRRAGRRTSGPRSRRSRQLSQPTAAMPRHTGRPARTRCISAVAEMALPTSKPRFA